LRKNAVYGSVESRGASLDLAVEDEVSDLTRLSDRNFHPQIPNDATLQSLLAKFLTFILEYHVFNPCRTVIMLDVVLSDALDVPHLGR
ncbi:hypothetical protein PMAYCL1PPCAC_28384, partial [Pristionchus mayeri]